MTDYLEEKLLKHVASIAAFTAPGTLYLALHTADPGDTGSASEASGGSYARQSVAFTWNSGAGRLDSSANVTFSNMPSGTFTHASVKDASSGGNTLMTGVFTSPQTLSAGQSLIVSSGDLRWTFD
jgi:hypothetical protein